MKRFVGLSLFVAVLALGLGAARAAEQQERWSLETLSKEGRVSFGQGGVAQGSGGVLVRYWSKDGKEAELTAFTRGAPTLPTRTESSCFPFGDSSRGGRHACGAVRGG